MSALALFIVYGNLGVTLNPQKLGFGSPGIPRPLAITDAFLIPGMFSGYTTFNFDFFLEGQRTKDGRKTDRGQRIALDLQEHFPLRQALTYTYLFAAHHWDIHGVTAQRAAWAVLARKIKARNNRLHPDARIDNLRFGVITFPQSPNGYRAAKTAQRSWRYVWYADP
jgi:hypothetical protein